MGNAQVFAARVTSASFNCSIVLCHDQQYCSSKYDPRLLCLTCEDR